MKALTYYISDAKLPDLDECWSACNGLDGFGHVDEDDELNAARRRHGEWLDMKADSPRLILYRKTKHEPLMAKLWTSRSIGRGGDSVLLLLGSLAKACASYCGTAVYTDLDLYLCNWGQAVGAAGEQHEISIEIVGRYADLKHVRREYRLFMKYFDRGEWK